MSLFKKLKDKFRKPNSTPMELPIIPTDPSFSVVPVEVEIMIAETEKTETKIVEAPEILITPEPVLVPEPVREPSLSVQQQFLIQRRQDIERKRGRIK